MKPMYQNMEYPQWMNGPNQRRGSKRVSDFSGTDDQGYYEGGGMQAPSPYTTGPILDAPPMMQARPVQRTAPTLEQIGMQAPQMPGMSIGRPGVGMDFGQEEYSQVPQSAFNPVQGRPVMRTSPNSGQYFGNTPQWAQARPVQRSPYQSMGPQGYPRTRNNAFDPRMWDILRMLQMR